MSEIDEVYKIFCPLSEREANIWNICYERAWNAAIEAAALEAEATLQNWVAKKIRKLKK